MSEPVSKPAPIRSVKGTRDLLPHDTALWQRIEEEARQVFGAYHFGEIRTPIIEQTSLFSRTVGEDTDIVSKEMYTWEDHELPDLALLRAQLRRIRMSFGTEESVFNWYVRQIQSFESQLRDAVTSGLAPKTPDNERALAELSAAINGISQARASGPSERFELRLDGLRQLLDAVRLGDSLTLRPEATASVVRAYIERSMFNEGGVHKLYYIGPMFRRDRPQKGRYRQFYQIGAEVLGSEHPGADVEVFEMLISFLSRLGLSNYTLLINSVGDRNCRPAYLTALREALRGVKDQMCGDCQRRADTNPLRVFDCKVPADQPIIDKLPRTIDHLDPECKQHFDDVLAGLDQRGIAYQVTPRLVRGLDYYTRTTYEITSDVLGAQNSILGGGRYDGLSEMLGGPPAPGTGFAIGEDRLVLAVEAAGQLKAARSLQVYVAWMGESTSEPASKLARELRERGVSVEMGYEPAKLKKALGTASKLGARFAVIIGEGELESGLYQVKDLDSGQQESVDPARLVEHIASKLAAK